MRECSDLSGLDLDVEAIVEVLEAAPVERGILFGSHARGDGRPASDVDLAVEFDESLSSIERTRARLELIARLRSVLGLDEIDVVPLARASPELRREIREDGIVLYGSVPESQSTSKCIPEHDETITRFDEILADLERVV